MSEEKDDWKVLIPGLELNKRTGDVVMKDTLKDVSHKYNERYYYLRKHRFVPKDAQGLTEEEIKEIRNEAVKYYYRTGKIPENVIAVNIYE